MKVKFITLIGVEQKQYLDHGYYTFKKHKAHQMMAHSFLGYKEGFDVHHKNQVKTDNRLQNLSYLTRAEHSRLHKIGNKNNCGKKLSPDHKAKINAKKKKQVYCVELDRVFAGVRIAARELSLHHCSISQCCKGKGKYKTTGGYHFQFVKV